MSSSTAMSVFYICPSLTSIVLPSGLEQIGTNAFYECGLEEVTLPQSVSLVAAGAFSNCDRLRALRVEPGNKRYDSRDGCNAIIETATGTLVAGCKNTVIPSTVTRIGDMAFQGCHDLTAIDIPSSVTQIGDHAFFYCTNLRQLDLPNSVTRIEAYAFCGCDSLERVTLPNSVTTIMERAFLHDDNIKSLTLGNGVKSIGEWAFMGLDALTSFTCHMPDASAVALGAEVFDEINTSACTLVVPRGAATSYRTAPQWSAFKRLTER